MRRLSFHRLAACELDEAAHYYESRSAGLGTMFVNSVEACTESILAFPNSGRLMRGQIRRRLVRGFPYAVVYKPHVDHIRVLAIMHMKRRPTYWAGRR